MNYDEKYELKLRFPTYLAYELDIEQEYEFCVYISDEQLKSIVAFDYDISYVRPIENIYLTIETLEARTIFEKWTNYIINTNKINNEVKILFNIYDSNKCCYQITLFVVSPINIGPINLSDSCKFGVLLYSKCKYIHFFEK